MSCKSQFKLVSAVMAPALRKMEYWENSFLAGWMRIPELVVYCTLKCGFAVKPAVNSSAHIG
jgi:hypothetical protein